MRNGLAMCLVSLFLALANSFSLRLVSWVKTTAAVGTVSLGALFNPMVTMASYASSIPMAVFNGEGTRASYSSLPLAVFNDDGEWIETEERTWQETWGARAEKASKMSRRDIFMAAKGAPKWDEATRGPESDKSKKRRAMAACSAPEYLDLLKITKIDCTKKALSGQTSEILKLIDES